MNRRGQHRFTLMVRAAIEVFGKLHMDKQIIVSHQAID